MYVNCSCFSKVDRGLLTECIGMNDKGQYVSGLSLFLELSVVTKYIVGISYRTEGYRMWQSSSLITGVKQCGLFKFRIKTPASCMTFHGGGGMFNIMGQHCREKHALIWIHTHHPSFQSVLDFCICKPFKALWFTICIICSYNCILSTQPVYEF
jgi:hypothetical protein